MQITINLEKQTDRNGSIKGPRQTDFQWKGDGEDNFGCLNLRPGFDLVVSRQAARKRPKVAFAFGDVPLELHFHIRGTRKYRIVCSHADRRECIAGAGQFAVNHLPFCHGEMQGVGDQDNLSMNIYITADFLRTFYPEAQWNGLPAPVLSVLQEKSGKARPVGQLASTSPEMAVAVQEIMNCPYQGVLGRMYLEGKSLELIAMALAHGGAKTKSRNPFSKKERDGVEAARFHLLNDLENPPDLDTLARIAGMNRNKLNRGFRERYGDSVFGVFRRERLDQALRLLDRGDLNVGEVAYAAGFKSHSHLTHAFVKQFGVSPKSYQKHPLNRYSPIQPPASRPPDATGLSDDPLASNLLKLIRSQQR